MLNPDLTVGATTFRHFVADDHSLLPMYRHQMIKARLEHFTSECSCIRSKP